jgi:hypothetical protein
MHTNQELFEAATRCMKAFLTWHDPLRVPEVGELAAVLTPDFRIVNTPPHAPIVGYEEYRNVCAYLIDRRVNVIASWEMLAVGPEIAVLHDHHSMVYRDVNERTHIERIMLVKAREGRICEFRAIPLDPRHYEWARQRFDGSV